MNADPALRFARSIRSIDWRDLSSDCFDRARKHVGDTIGVAALGHPIAGIPEDACISLEDRILRMSAAVRASEADDIHLASCTTPGSIVIPVAMAIGAARRANDRQFLAAVVAGYEAVVRFGLAVQGPRILLDGIWPSLLVAPMGAAATAGYLLDLTAEQLFQAMSIAANRASGAFMFGHEPSGRFAAFGSAVAEGVRCARFAAAGLCGDATFVNAQRHLSGTKIDLESLGLRGELFALEETSLKPFCTARQALSAIEAAEQAAKDFDPRTITRIVVYLPPACRFIVDRPKPSEVLAIGSVQCQIACALLARDSLYLRRKTAQIADPEICALMARVEIQDDEELAALYPDHWGARVEIWVGEKRSSARVTQPLGSPDNPLQWQKLLVKLSQSGNSSSTASNILDAAQRLGQTEEGNSLPKLLRLAH